MRGPAKAVAALAASLVAGAAGAALAADAAGPALERVAAVEGISEYRLPNGLRVLLFPDPARPSVTVNVTYLVGSRHEHYGETGMAHLLEHLLFKGTPTHPNLYQELTARGARTNASTWYDRTNYYETLPASDENLDWALGMEADRMLHSFIARKDLDSEMTVVRNEFEAGENDPRGVLEERTLSGAFLWHNYGNSTIGARSDIENVSIERLQAFYRTYYQPDNAVLLLAGRFDEAQALAKVARHFGGLPRPERTLSATWTREPAQDGERAVTLRRVGDVQAVCAVYHTPAGSHEDAAALSLLAFILGDSPSGRLHKALVEPGLAADVSASSFALREPSFAVFRASVRKQGRLEAARDALLRSVEGVAAEPPSAEEVERARAALLKGVELTLNNSDRVGLALSEFIAMGDWRLFFLRRDRLKAVTAADVARVAAAYLRPSNRTLGLFVPEEAPERAAIPEAPDTGAQLQGYQGEQAKAQAEAFDPTPETLDARTRRLTLANGASVALLPKRTRGGSVVVSMAFRFGDEESLRGRSRAAALAGQMLMRGTLRNTRQQIRDALDRLKARGGASGGATQASASIETVRESLPDALRLLAEILREPAFPDTEFELLRQELLAGLEEQRREPQALAFRSLDRHLNPAPKGDVRYVPTLEEEIAEVQAATRAEAAAFHREFYGASNAQLAVVGDFDPDAVAALLGELFGGWRSPREFARVRAPYQAVPALRQQLETPDKANAAYGASTNLELRDDDPDYPALLLGNYLLGGGFLNSRLAVRLRQKDGLSYGAGSALSAHPLDRAGSFTVYAIAAPENVGRVEAAVQQELARALADGFAPEEFAAARSGLLQARQLGRAQDGRVAASLASGLYLGRTFAWEAELDARLAALTPEAVRDALGRWIDPKQLSVAVAGDFAKAPASAAPAPEAKP